MKPKNQSAPPGVSTLSFLPFSSHLPPTPFPSRWWPTRRWLHLTSLGSARLHPMGQDQVSRCSTCLGWFQQRGRLGWQFPFLKRGSSECSNYRGITLLPAKNLLWGAGEEALANCQTWDSGITVWFLDPEKAYNQVPRGSSGGHCRNKGYQALC